VEALFFKSLVVYRVWPRNADVEAYRIKDINTHCLAEFRKHWECLDDRNHQLWQCRPAEWKLNKCVYENLVCYPSGSTWF
jgi:hypothetical protein